MHELEPKLIMNLSNVWIIPNRTLLQSLQPFTKTHTCLKQMCHQYHKKHNLLHRNNQNQTVNDKGSTTNNRSVDAKGITTTEVNTYCSLKGKPRNHILFATAIVEFRNKSGQYVPCRTLLDSAFQSHFVTCVQHFRLSWTQTHASVQGISNVNTATHHSVSILLRSRHTDWHMTLDCAVLCNITGTTPSTKLDTSSWKIPKDMKLADEQLDQPGSTDLLIGADLLYEMLRSHRRTHPGNFPVLQETVLGWTISGRTPAATQNGPQHTFLLWEDNRLEHNWNRFWEVEPLEQSTMPAGQQTCEEQFLTHTHTHTQPNSQIADLWLYFQPRWNPTKLEILAPVEWRLHAIERRLEQDPELKVQYHNFTKEYEDLSRMEPVKSHEGRNTCYFLPHHPVFK